MDDRVGKVPAFEQASTDGGVIGVEAGNFSLMQRGVFGASLMDEMDVLLDEKLMEDEFADVVKEARGESEFCVAAEPMGENLGGDCSAEGVLPEVEAGRSGLGGVEEHRRCDHLENDAVNFPQAKTQDGRVEIFHAVRTGKRSTVRDAQDISGQARIEPNQVGEHFSILVLVPEKDEKLRDEIQRGGQKSDVGAELEVALEAKRFGGNFARGAIVGAVAHDGPRE